MNIIVYPLLAALLISAASFVGIIIVFFKTHKSHHFLLMLVALSAGVMMGNAFLHLLPESFEEIAKEHSVFELTISGFIAFFLLEKLIHWHHGHDPDHPDVHAFAYVNLVGDGIHNFLDGIILTSAFFIEPALGWTTTFAIILHEIPQEMSDFGVLLYAGIPKTKALIFNFFTALMAVIGVLVGYTLTQQATSFSNMILPVAAGGFIYIAASDLLPEINKTKKLSKAMVYFFIFVLGVSLMWVLA